MVKNGERAVCLCGVRNLEEKMKMGRAGTVADLGMDGICEEVGLGREPRIVHP